MKRAIEPSPGGSTWRRWDPHVHLPGTAANDQFGGMSIAAALDLLASRDPHIEVAGITDYCTTEIYKQAVFAWEAGAGSTLALLFPNVELRLATGTQAGRGVNLHLLCPPDQVDELDRFLAGLEFKVGGDTYRCTRDDLIRLGRYHERDRSLPDQAALRCGANQFKVELGGLKARADESGWFRRNCLVAVAAGQGDGTSGLRSPDGGFEQLRREIESFANLILSSNQADISFWLGRSGKISADELRSTRGGVKPCMHGSDAHGPDRLGVPDEGRYTWVNGDPMFDTLRMACLSPATRVHIGDRDPAAASRRIAAVSVDAPWFPNGELPINPGLVAIIGARGSGKTALADLIAAGAGAEAPFLNDRSFLSRARERLEAAPTSVAVAWSDGDATRAELGTQSPNEDWAPEPVRYLSQQFVDDLCAADGVSRQLLEEIERVVFEACPRQDRQGATTFKDLLATRVEPAKIRMVSAKLAVESVNAELAELRELRDSEPALHAEALSLERRLLALSNTISALTGQTDGARAERFSAVSQALDSREAAAQVVDRRLQALTSLRVAVNDHSALEARRIEQEWPRTYAATGLTPAQWQQFRLQHAGDVGAVLDAALRDARNSLLTLRGDVASDMPADPLDHVEEAELEARTIAELRAELHRLQGLLKLDERRAQQLRQAGEERATTAGRLANVQTTLALIEAAPEREQRLRAERQDKYAAYFNALLEQEQHLAALYAPLVEVLARAGGSAQKLEFTVRRVIDIEAWAQEGEGLLDLRRGQQFRGAGSLSSAARDALHGPWSGGSGAEASEALAHFNAAHHEELRSQARKRDGETNREWELRVAAWLFGLDHVGLHYSLRYDGVEIERLSPGTRGIVLLLLYLAIDQQETDPLLIDQPEENLDPESVYNELVALFREASTRRQIIMVTHNANLVVNTDVDQVIVARAGHGTAGELPQLEYRSGGMENPEIRRAVCEVLEGGEAAFRERARRLGLEWHS